MVALYHGGFTIFAPEGKVIRIEPFHYEPMSDESKRRWDEMAALTKPIPGPFA